MERVLDVYALAYDADYRVVCFDERPCQLIDDVLEPVPPSEGKLARQYYHYKRNGHCVVLMAIEPLTGKRVVEVCDTKKRPDYARFMKKVAKAWKASKKIKLIQDNLNTHSYGSFYVAMKAQQAFALMQKIEMIYTPKKASWLNMVEIEFSALSKQCLDRRIGNIETLRKEVETWTKKKSRKRVKINWQFSIQDARKKFAKRYSEICNN